MRDLELIGVHDDGEHLILGLDDGQQFLLPMDSALAHAIQAEYAEELEPMHEPAGADASTATPRTVQAMIRGGASAAEVAAKTGWSLEKISRFDGPVLAERAHIAELAHSASLPDPYGASETVSLSYRVAQRLEERGVNPEMAEWDAARTSDGGWIVKISFVAGERERRASWFFDVAGRSVVAKDDEARWLSQAPGAPEQPLPQYSAPRPVSAGKRPESLPFHDLVPTHSELRAHAAAAAEVTEEMPEPKSKGRPSVPPWDQVIFGGHPSHTDEDHAG